MPSDEPHSWAPGAADRLDLLDALVYADIFGCAPTLDELWRYSRVSVGREELRAILRDDPALARIVVERDGLYCLADRPDLIERRRPRIERSGTLERRARRVARTLRHVPFVRGLALTGSVAAGDAGEDADVDLLVLVEPGRLGFVFLLLGAASRLTARRLFCPNYYLAVNSLGLGPHTLYLARELAQTRPLTGVADRLFAVNPWLEEFFPNTALNGNASSRELRLGVQRALEAILHGPLGDRLERLGRRVALSRLEAHHAGLDGGVPADVSASFEASVALRFHRGQVGEVVLERYASRRREVAAMLGPAGRTEADAVAAGIRPEPAEL